MTIAVYPGSFDPLTNGHLNLLERSLALFDRVIVAVSNNIRKTPLFTTQERMEMIREVVGNDDRIEVDAFDGLLVKYAEKRGAKVILRGLRAIADFEYEFQMTHMNRQLAAEIETVFMMTGEEHFYVSSSLVREVAGFGGSVTGLVPPSVEKRLLIRLKNAKSAGSG